MKNLFRRQISLGQKTAEGSSPFGRGYNYSVEVFVPVNFVGFASILDNVLSSVDHRALGVDVDLGFEPDSTRLCSWLHKQMEEKSGVVLRSLWRRGDGFTFSIGID